MVGRQIIVAVVALASAAVPTASSALIRPGEARIELLPGDSTSVLFLVEDVATPLFGYSLDVDATSAADAVGVVAIDPAASSFFEAQNLITAGGAQLDPFFSLIQSDEAGGVFVNANTTDLATVVPVTGVNDVLAELVFVAGPDAFGSFAFDLGPATALSDGNGFPVAFEGRSLVIDVVPEPATAGMLVVLSAVTLCRWRRCCITSDRGNDYA